MISNSGSYSRISTSARQYARTSTTPCCLPLTHSLRANPSNRAPVTATQASSRRRGKSTRDNQGDEHRHQGFPLPHRGSSQLGTAKMCVITEVWLGVSPD